MSLEDDTYNNKNIDGSHNNNNNNNNDQVAFGDVICELENLNGIYFDSYKEKFKWANQLKELTKMYSEISTFAHKFDFSPAHRFNGLRSLLKIIDIHFDSLCKTIGDLKSDPGEEKFLTKLKVHQKHSFAILSMGETMMKINKIYPESNSFDSPIDEKFVQEAQEILIQSIKRHQDSNRLAFFPLQPEWFRSHLRNLMRIAYFITTPLSKSIFNFFTKDAAREFYNNRATNDIPIVRNNVNNIINSWIFKLYVWITNLINYAVEVSDVTLYDRQRKWTINTKSQSIEKSDQADPEPEPVKCVYVKSRGFKGGNLILFVHGGGFSMGASKLYLTTFRQMVKITGAAILSVDYSLSPGAKYPMALQECLDVYLNLHSSCPITDFKADKIILAGDSAGGHLVTAMSIAIAELRHLQASTGEAQLTPLPHAVDAIYPLITCLSGHVYPSRVLLDFLIPSIYASIANSYAGSFNEGAYHRENKLPWQEDLHLVRKVSSEVNSRFTDPFLHLPGYKNFDRLKSVPLYVQASEFDSILDDSIAIAKCWKGPVTLDILPDVTHAWMSFSKFAPKNFVGRTLVQNRLKEAFDRKSLVDNNNENENENEIA